jgi:gas vesicle protein
MADETPQADEPATAAGAPLADSEKSPEQLRSEIAEAREDLGETVEQLAAKADVKTRAHEAVEDAKGRAQDKVEEGKGQVRHAAERVQATAQQKREEGIHTEDVRGAAQTGVAKAKANPALAIAAGVGVALLVIVILRRRNH